MNCKLCIKLYDLSNELLYPQIVLPCCHTFCVEVNRNLFTMNKFLNVNKLFSKCLDQLKENDCPDCSQMIVDRKANFGLLDLLDQKCSKNQSISVNLQNLEIFRQFYKYINRRFSLYFSWSYARI